MPLDGQPTVRREPFLAGDAIRGLAALGVLTVHASSLAANHTGYGQQLTDPAIGYPGLFGTWTASMLIGGGLGYFVFFVLSGYLIGGPYVRAVVERRPAQPVGAFLRNRVLRVVPAYWLTLVAILLIFVLAAGEANPSTGQVAGVFGFHIASDNPLIAWYGQVWTLEVEAKFYLSVAVAAVVLVPLLRRVPGRPAVRAALVASACLAWFVAAPFVEMGVHSGEHPFPHYLSLLLGGVALAAVEPLVRDRVEGRRAVGVAGAVAACLGVAYCLAVVGLDVSVGQPFGGDWGELMAHVAVVLIVAGPLAGQWATGRSWRAVDNRATRWLGERSYSFYLVHLAVLWGLAQVLAELEQGYKVTTLLLVPLGIVASAAIADVMFRLVERPFLRRKRGPAAAQQVPPPVAPQPVTEPAR